MALPHVHIAAELVNVDGFYAAAQTLKGTLEDDDVTTLLGNDRLQKLLSKYVTRRCHHMESTLAQTWSSLSVVLESSSLTLAVNMSITSC